MKRTLPPWVLGLAFAPLGFYYGFVTTALPILLTGRGIPVSEVATVSSLAFSPTWCGFLLTPILEIGLSRKQWAVLWVVVAAACLCGAIFSFGHLVLLTALLVAGCEAIVLFSGALGAWVSEAVEDESRNSLGASMNVANLGAAGSFGALAVVLMRHAPLPVAAGILAALLVLPMALLVFFPDEAALRRSVGQVFGKFWHDLKRVWVRREVMLGMLAFLLPESCFALTNLFSGLGRDFHVSEGWVTAIGGTGVAVACSLGCLVGVPLCNRYSRRQIYLTTGIGGTVFTAGLLLTPHTMLTFAVGLLGYNFVQGINYTAFSAWQVQLTGANNPQGAMQFAVFAAAANLPLTYMTMIEGRGYAAWGLRGMFGIDAATSVVMGVVLLLIFAKIDRRARAV